MSSGGPYYGFMCCRQAHVRQMPGRIVGRTVDLEGRPGYTLTLQAREQHIRRSKATSNICTNQGLMVTASTIHMALMGGEGLREAAAASHANTRALAERVTALPGVSRVFGGPCFHEVVLRLAAPVDQVLAAMGEQDLLAGYPLGEHYPELADCILVCATEKRTGADLEAYASTLGRVLEHAGAAPAASRA
jgi:glycine dehydrogenase subunit 1